RSRAHPALHSFPTRRSSDLLLVYLARYSMSKDQNNLGMAGATGVNDSPLSEEGGNGVAADQEQNRFDGDSLSAEEFTDLKTKARSEEHTSELQSRGHLVCRL